MVDNQEKAHILTRGGELGNHARVRHGIGAFEPAEVDRGNENRSGHRITKTKTSTTARRECELQMGREYESP